MSAAGTPGDRIERLLAVAGHPATNPYEAATALEGARRIVKRFDLGKQYGVRMTGIALQLASRNAAGAMTAFPASMRAALKAFQDIEKIQSSESGESGVE